jgi:hypothetical protein
MDENQTDKTHADENHKIVELNTEETEQVVGGAGPVRTVGPAGHLTADIVKREAVGAPLRALDQ